jgi:hypothetical protein
MDYLPPFVVHGALGMRPDQIDRHASEYRSTLEALRDETFDLEVVAGFSRLNANLDVLLKQGAGED